METEIEERIRVLAYAIWEAEGRPDGKHLEHWLQARRLAAAEAPQAMSQVALATRAPSSAKGVV
jgi:hypothetical protein